MKTLTPTIKICQEKYLTKILGSGLYADLQDKIYATANNLSGSTQLNDDEKFLLNAYIQPLLCQLILQEVPLMITYKLMNKGLSTQSSDNSNPASLAEVQSFTNHARSTADWYTQRIMNYLIANMTLYPTYQQEKTYDDVAPNSRGYKTGVYLGQANWGFGPGYQSGCIDCDARYFYR